MKINRRRFLIGSASTAGLSSVAKAHARNGPSTVTVTGLKVDYLDKPMGSDNPHPRLSWRLEAQRRNVRQTAYRIQVASNAALLRRGSADLWDSGKVGSAQSFGIPYGGRRLTPRVKFWWRVQIWDERLSPSAPSDASWWETGLFEDWNAEWLAAEGRAGREEREAGLQWIWGSDNNPDGGTRAFRYEFTLKSSSLRGSLYAIANDWVMWTQITAIYLDGSRLAGSGAWRDADGEAEPSLHQLLLGSLERGRHVLAIEVKTRKSLPSMEKGPLRYGLAIAAGFELEDGGRLRISTEQDWKTSASPEANWYQIEFLDGHWKAAQAPNITDYQPLPLQPAMYLRREFSVDKTVARSRLYITALGAYEARINGQRVGNALLTPEPSQYDKRVLYRTYDVTDMMRTGANAIGLVVGDGWYASFDGRFSWGPPPRRVLARLEVIYADGASDTVVTGPGWQTAESPIRQSEMKRGEIYDARLEQPGWDLPGFSARDWDAAHLATTPKIRVTAHIGPPIRVTATLAPIRFWQVRHDAYVFDFGQNFSGWCRLHVRAPAGHQIEMRFSELLTDEHEVSQPYMNIGVPKSDIYIARGSQQGETFEPHFTYRGFRYVQVTGLPDAPTTDTLTGIVVHTDAKFTGQLRSSAPIVQQLWQSTVWTERSSFVGLPTDTPSREQRSWASTARTVWDGACFDMDLCAHTVRYLDSLFDGQRGDGSLPLQAAEPRHGNAFYQGAGTPPGHGYAALLVTWTAWTRYGDLQLIERYWDHLNDYLQFILNLNPDYVWRNGRSLDFSDWLALNELAPNSDLPPTPAELIATACWAHSAILLSRMAIAIGRVEDAKHLGSVAARVQEAFNANFVTTEGVVGTGSQTGYVVALRFGLLPPQTRASSAALLAKSIQERSVSLTTGAMGTMFILDALADTDYSELAYGLLLRTEFPSWGYMIKNGATTVWESWSGGQEWKGQSGQLRRVQLGTNHPELASASGFLFRRVAGIDAGMPGFQSIIVRPLVDPRISSAGGDYDSTMGRISTDWSQLADGGFRIQVTIPPNATARIYIPAPSTTRIFESGRDIHDHNDISVLSRTDTHFVVQVGSGAYDFLRTG